MSKYTPEYVREEYARSSTPFVQKQYENRFDEMLKRVKAEAWDEGKEYGERRANREIPFQSNPYLEETK